ncbi:MAG: SufE family protein [Coriobacteriaceae bacterium]|nr:SufE family protein [Coriobacteriaceae bacterium]
MKPTEVQDEIIAAFNAQGEAFEQFDYLLQLAAELDEMDESDKVSDVLVDGCQSQVWLYLDWTGDAPGKGFHLRGDSDTLMVRGIIRIFELMFNGQDAAAVAECPIEFVEKTELMYIFDSKRQAGVASIVGDMKDFAKAALA